MDHLETSEIIFSQGRSIVELNEILDRFLMHTRLKVYSIYIKIFDSVQIVTDNES